MEKYDIISQIGKGAYGLVYKIIEKATGRIFVMKEVLINIQLKNYIDSESKINELLKSNNPPYINYAIERFSIFKPLLGKAAAQEYVIFILPYCNSGDLNSYIETKINISESESKIFIEQITKAIRFFHNHKIMHRDIKPQNVLLHINPKTDKLDSYVCDFGFSKQCPDYARSAVGSPSYMAPEMNQDVYNYKYTNKIDIWALGMTIYKMLVGKAYITGMDEIKELQNSKLIKFPSKLRLSSCILSFIECCLQYEPSKRFSADELLAHEFLTCKHVPWYYFDWICSEQQSIVIDCTKFIYTEQMKKARAERMKSFEENSMLYSFSEYYSSNA